MRILIGTILFLLIMMAPDRAWAHTEEEMDQWFEEWIETVNDALSPALILEFNLMYERHGWYWVPVVNTRTGTSGTYRGDVEQWRPLVTAYFPASQVSTAMRVLNCETGGTGDPNSKNPNSSASGLFQHLSKYWAGRSEKAGWGGADIMDPEANVAVAAWLQRTGGWGHWTCY